MVQVERKNVGPRFVTREVADGNVLVGEGVEYHADCATS